MPNRTGTSCSFQQCARRDALPAPWFLSSAGSAGANRALGLSDKLFCLGDSVLITALARVALMPVFVLAARICPEVGNPALQKHIGWVDRRMPNEAPCLPACLPVRPIHTSIELDPFLSICIEVRSSVLLSIRPFICFAALAACLSVFLVFPATCQSV
jgi:BT1 family